MKTEKRLMEQSRRSFLKATSLVALGAALSEADGETAPRPAPAFQPPVEAESDLVGLVNVLQGTDSNYYFSRGNTLPIAAMPFGMAHWTLQSRDGTPWMFQPGDRRMQGFRCTHQLSPWLSDYGYAIFFPFSGEPKPDPDARSSSYRPEDARLSPHSLRLKLLRYEADVELVPSERCCVISAMFVGDGPRGLMVEIPGKSGSVEPDAARRTL